MTDTERFDVLARMLAHDDTQLEYETVQPGEYIGATAGALEDLPAGARYFALSISEKLRPDLHIKGTDLRDVIDRAVVSWRQWHGEEP